MRILRHLLWIIPVIILILDLAYAAMSRSIDASYHSRFGRTIAVSSNTFQADQEMPAEVACKGAGVSPQIQWSNPPAGAKSYVLIAMDWDAPSPLLRLFSFVHWVLYNIPGDATQIEKGASSQELGRRKMVSGLNSGGGAGYTAPCPPMGTHRYEFRIYALDVDSIQPASNDRAGVMKAMVGHILGYGELAGLRSH